MVVITASFIFCTEIWAFFKRPWEIKSWNVFTWISVAPYVLANHSVFCIISIRSFYSHQSNMASHWGQWAFMGRRIFGGVGGNCQLPPGHPHPFYYPSYLPPFDPSVCFFACIITTGQRKISLLKGFSLVSQETSWDFSFVVHQYINSVTNVIPKEK